MKKIATVLFLLLPNLFAFAAEQTNPGPAITLPEISVLGEALQKSAFDVAPSVSEISGTKLERKKKSTLGETLSSELGVTSSFFGPNASRPIIRGQDGERIRILNNGMGVLDASGASQDHGVSIDPLIIERVEIVRGPSALLYGSSAVGGVVNTVTNRISEKKIEGLNGKFDLQSTSVDDGKSGSLDLNYGVGSWVLHVDGTNKDLKDYKVPGFARTAETRQNVPLGPGEVEGNNSVPNSANKTESGALGASYVFDNGFAGASYSKYNSNYGTVAEQGVSIKMKQERADIAFGLKDLDWIRSIRLKNSYSDYEHKEMEGGQVGTTFTNRGNETRLELAHEKVGSWSGLFGLQSNVFKFAAIGDERFLPETDNKNIGAFVYEEAEYGSWKPSLGLRYENSTVKANETFLDVNPSNLGEASFGGPATSKNFEGLSASLGVIYSLAAQHSLALNVALTERAPNYQELFTNGAHLATAAYERGDLSLRNEKSHSAEISYRYKGQRAKGLFGIFVQDFKDYISLSPKAGGGFDPRGAPNNRDLSRYQYESVDAQFYGAEFEISKEFMSLVPQGKVELGLKVDVVKAKNKTTGDNLPRITPMRETLSAEYKTEKYALNAEVQNIHRQNDTAPNETGTNGYTLVNTGLEVPFDFGRLTLNFYGRINNVFDAEARSHVSFLKSLAPLPGRNFQVGLQGTF